MLKSIFLFALLVGFAAGQEPPPFGTVIEQWNLPMSGSYAGSGITWNQSTGRFYLVDQGYQLNRVYELEPDDPLGTIEVSPWAPEPIQGASSQIDWGIAWDPDSNCFWVSAIVDGQLFGGCYLLRYVWNGDTWVWGGAPGDSWMVGDGSNGGALECLWIAGMDKHRGDGLYYAVPVHSSPSELNHVVRFDPYTKTNLGRVANGDQTSERGCALVSWDSSYILTCGWNSSSYRKRDSTGYLLANASASPGPADWSLHALEDPRADDTVCAFCIHSNPANTLQRVSLGMLWWQLGSVGVKEKRPAAHSRQPTATVCRGSLVLPRTLDPSTPWTLVSITGRKVMDIAPGPNDIRHIAPGVYFVRRPETEDGRPRTAVRKVIIQR
jgi:hypothetical protein